VVAAPGLPGAICARTSQYARSGRQVPTTGTDEGEEPERQTWPPTRAADEMRLQLGLRH